MPSQLKIDSEIHNIIVHEVVRTFGRQIVSSRDCIQLSEDIFEKTRDQVSPNTLRRIFGLVKADYPPSYGTCQILMRYCGFTTVEELVKFRQTQSGDGDAALCRSRSFTTL